MASKSQSNITFDMLVPSERIRLVNYFFGIPESRLSRQGHFCHLWRGKKNQDKYGVVKLTLDLKSGESKTKEMLIHRLAYYAVHREKGFDPEKDFGVSHLCGVRLCANPEHLTYENIQINLDRRPCHLKGVCSGHDGHKDCVFEVRTYD